MSPLGPVDCEAPRKASLRQKSKDTEKLLSGRRCLRLVIGLAPKDPDRRALGGVLVRCRTAREHRTARRRSGTPGIYESQDRRCWRCDHAQRNRRCGSSDKLRRHDLELGCGEISGDVDGRLTGESRELFGAGFELKVQRLIGEVEAALSPPSRSRLVSMRIGSAVATPSLTVNATRPQLICTGAFASRCSSRCRKTPMSNSASCALRVHIVPAGITMAMRPFEDASDVRSDAPVPIRCTRPLMVPVVPDPVRPKPAE